MAQHHARAVLNIARFGDTDIFTFPIENSVFHDMHDEAVAMLEEAERKLPGLMKETDILYEDQLSVVGYAGYRMATQIDPFWNALYLSLVCAIAEKVEEARLGREQVFAYRYNPDTSGKLFDDESNWGAYRDACAEHAKSCKIVMICDVADFYGRVYHHRIKNALDQAAPGSHYIPIIDDLLMKLRANQSYGLPIGGPASRILAEIALDRCDRLLAGKGIKFCRFVDDYTFFVDSRDEAYMVLHYLTSKLSVNDGLTIQKAKTRIMSSKEYLGMLAVEVDEVERDPAEKMERDFMMIRWRFDPYAASAEDDYQELKAAVGRFDIVQMLGREVKKSRINPALARKLLAAVRVLEGKPLRDAVLSLLQSAESLYPVISQVLLLLKHIVDAHSNDAKLCEMIFDSVRRMLSDGGRLMLTAPARAFAVRIVARDSRQEASQLLVRLFESEESHSVRRDVFYAMINRGDVAWLGDQLKKSQLLMPWEKRALVAASYLLGDEGRNWREKNSKSWDPLTELVAKWASKRKQNNVVNVPL